jgi:hypothetical protein
MASKPESSFTDAQLLQYSAKYMETLSDALLLEDIELLNKYLVMRFLKTSPFALPGMPQEFVQCKLVEFLSGINPILLAFVTAANSSAMNHVGDA